MVARAVLWCSCLAWTARASAAQITTASLAIAAVGAGVFRCGYIAKLVLVVL